MGEERGVHEVLLKQGGHSSPSIRASTRNFSAHTATGPEPTGLPTQCLSMLPLQGAFWNPKVF